MVGHPVVDHANPTPVGFPSKLLVIVQGAQAWVDLVAVRACVAVVGRFGQVVFHDWRHPNGSDAQIFEIPQTIGHSLKVSTVPRVHLSAVHPAFLGAFDVVVVGIAVGKPVRHDQIHGRNRFPLVQPIASIQQRIHMEGDILLLASLGRHCQHNISRRFHAAHVQLNPNVTWQPCGSPSLDHHKLISACHPGHHAQFSPRHQHFNTSLLEVSPPIGRIDIQLA